MWFVILGLAGVGAWLISTISGGGSPFILVPIINLMIDVNAVPPVVTIGMLIGNAHRAVMFGKEVDWQITKWYVPGAIVGGVLGAFTYSQFHAQWLQVAIGLFLASSIFTYGFGQKEKSFSVSAWYFLPGGVLYAFLSGVIGSIGPVLNPFYLNYGLLKERMIGTKSVHMVAVHLIKIIAYAAFGSLHPEYLVYGLLIGIAAIPGNWLGQMILQRVSDRQFRLLVISLVTVSGLFILWQQRDFFGISI